MMVSMQSSFFYLFNDQDEMYCKEMHEKIVQQKKLFLLDFIVFVLCRIIFVVVGLVVWIW